MIDRVKPQPVRHGDGTRENKTKIKIFYCEAATVCTVNNEADINLQWTVTHAALFPVNFLNELPYRYVIIECKYNERRL